jgi:dihydroorotate dehydrogenase electron transfer subunit
VNGLATSTSTHNPLNAAFYADRAIRQNVRIVENVQIARDTYRVRFECPEIARRIVPGQFLMVRIAGLNDPLLARPLALYDTVLDENQSPKWLDIVYLTLGKMTRRLAQLTPSAELDLWGPLGNGFPPIPTKHLIMVAGGIGQTPFLALGQEYLDNRKYGEPARSIPRAERVTLCYGVRTADLLAGARRASTSTSAATMAPSVITGLLPICWAGSWMKLAEKIGSSSVAVLSR